MPNSWLDALKPQAWHDDSYRILHETFISRDWHAKLGFHLTKFPPTLRMAVCQCFGTTAPVVLGWGPDLVQIYNSAYMDIVSGSAHPKQMGGRWLDTMPNLLPDWEDKYAWVQRVCKEGVTHKGVNTRHYMTRQDLTKVEFFYDHNTTPLRDADGKIVGVYTLLINTTNTVKAQRRDATFSSLQRRRDRATSPQETFEAIRSAVDENPYDFPCTLGYHCNESLVDAHIRTYSMVVASGCITDKLPEIVSTTEADLWHPKPGQERDLKDYMLEAIHRKCPVKLTDSAIISQFCTRRAYGELTITAWVSPIYAFGHCLPAGISIQGICPRSSQDDSSLAQRLSREIAESVELVARRFRMSQELQAKTAELAASERKFAVMAQFCPAGIFILNLETKRFDFANDAYFEITGIPRAAGAESWEAYCHPDSLETAKNAWASVATHPICGFEARWKKPWRDQIERWTASSASMHLDAQGHRYIFGAFTDTSAMRYALKVEKERADAAIKTKQLQLEFLDMIAHELRNPLGAIMQSADLLLGKVTETEHQLGSPSAELQENVDDMRIIVLCAQHMSRIINDTLNLSKLEGGMLIATLVPTQILSVLRNILTMFEAETRRGGIEISLELEESFKGIDWISTDPARFSQIVINLLANSIKFVARRDTKKITITLGTSRAPMDAQSDTRRRPGTIHRSSSERCSKRTSAECDPATLYLLCRITDTGPGMSEAQVASLFQRYFQASPKTHVEYGGSGLGLFISKQLVDLLQGSIRVESEEDYGTTFMFSIKTSKCAAPRVKPVAQKNKVSPPPTHLNAAAVADTILVAEDNLINQKILIKQLKNAGYATLVANNGREAVDILIRDRASQSRIAICLCDVEMPVMSGIAAIREVRELEQSGRLPGHCPFVAVTANARHEQLQEMRDAGMDDTVAKPFHFPNLLSKVTEVMERIQLPQIPTENIDAPLVEPSAHSIQTNGNRPATQSDHAAKVPTNGVISDKEFDSITHGDSSTPPAIDKSVVAMPQEVTARNGTEHKSHTRHRRISDFWSPSATKDSVPPFKCILLNTSQPKDIARTIWQKVRHTPSSVRICADGATDRLHDELFNCSLESLEAENYPDIIIGDLDSIQPSTKNFYTTNSDVQIIRVEDQNSTDFTKAIRHITMPTQAAEDERDIIVLGGIGGRTDQTFSSINSLFLRPRIYLIDTSNVVFLLQAGSHEIDCTGLGPHCGLAPLRGPARCWSAGLEWCLNGETMDLGGLISTNNRVVSDDSMVHVRTDGDVLFSIELKTT